MDLPNRVVAYRGSIEQPFAIGSGSQCVSAVWGDLHGVAPGCRHAPDFRRATAIRGEVDKLAIWRPAGPRGFSACLSQAPQSASFRVHHENIGVAIRTRVERELPAIDRNSTRL